MKDSHITFIPLDPCGECVDLPRCRRDGCKMIDREFNKPKSMKTKSEVLLGIVGATRVSLMGTNDVSNIFKAMHEYAEQFKPSAATTGVHLIAEERSRQINSEGWTPEHDDQHIYGELAQAGACYAVAQDVRDSTDGDEPADFWPRSWNESWWKPTPDNRIKELAKAGALIAAEIDRLQRLENNHAGGPVRPEIETR